MLGILFMLVYKTRYFHGQSVLTSAIIFFRFKGKLILIVNNKNKTNIQDYVFVGIQLYFYQCSLPDSLGFGLGQLKEGE